MLRDNICAGYSESREYKKHLPQKAIEFATAESLQGAGAGHYELHAQENS